MTIASLSSVSRAAYFGILAIATEPWLLYLAAGLNSLAGLQGILIRWPRPSITGQNGVHLVREISPWSSQVLCIGLAQNLKPILSDDKYWNINPNISAFGMWLICDNTWMYNIQAYAWMYHIQAFAWPQIWPNPIPNPIHGCNTFKIFEHMYALKYQQIWPNPISNPIHGLAIIKF